MRQNITAQQRKSSAWTHHLRGILSMLVALLVTGCTTTDEHMAARAHRAGASDIIIESKRFRHLLIRNHADLIKPSSHTLIIFLEGDGTPWINHGTTPASDPTPRKPLAFDLFLNTYLPAWYLARPCYNGLLTGCDSNDWTYGRYSESIVGSMADAIHSQLGEATKDLTNRSIILIGYSGGGALATLIAARLPSVTGIVTIAANLDTQAWTELHQYEPLTSSLNPADLDALTIPHIVMSGGQDSNVPLSSVARFIEKQPNTVVNRYANYDHVCCWEQDWPKLLNAALEQLRSIPTLH
jgi:pimeloyl-ACP methyl ester carboxylesterase